MRAEVVGSYLAEERWADAVAECEKLLAMEPPDAWKEYLMYIAGSSAARMGRNTEAVAMLQRVIDEFPKGEWALAARSRLAGITAR